MLIDLGDCEIGTPRHANHLRFGIGAGAASSTKVTGAQAGMPVLLKGEDNLGGPASFENGDAVRDDSVAAMDGIGGGAGLAVGETARDSRWVVLPFFIRRCGGC